MMCSTTTLLPKYTAHNVLGLWVVHRWSSDVIIIITIIVVVVVVVVVVLLLRAHLTYRP